MTTTPRKLHDAEIIAILAQEIISIWIGCEYINPNILARVSSLHPEYVLQHFEHAKSAAKLIAHSCGLTIPRIH